MTDRTYEFWKEKAKKIQFPNLAFIDGLISLPEKTFFTTPKKTYILAITKKTNKQDIQKEPVFTYLVSEIGESRDIYRFDIEQNGFAHI